MLLARFNVKMRSLSQATKRAAGKNFSSKKKKKKKKISQVIFVGIAERGGRTRNLEIKSLTLYRLS
jgi:hypothetical protein